MGFFEILGIGVFLYYVINVILWIILDSDVQLFIKQKTGAPISTLSGQVVWIAGASSGIGKQLALILAKNGVRLCLSARREAELEQVKKECLAASGRLLTTADVLVMKMDMLETDKQRDHFERVLAHFGKIDVLVNNAGRSQRAEWQDVQLEVDREVFELDVFAVVNLTRIYLNHVLQTKRKGHVAVTSSSAGLIGVPNSCSYVGAKFAIHGYFESLKVENPNLDVTIFCPGPTTTEFLEHAFTDKTGQKYGQTSESSTKRMSAERCAFLMATAIANKLFLSFVGPYPVPLLLNVCLYYPNLKQLLINLMGTKQLSKIRDPEKKDHKL